MNLQLVSWIGLISLICSVFGQTGKKKGSWFFVVVVVVIFLFQHLVSIVIGQLDSRGKGNPPSDHNTPENLQHRLTVNEKQVSKEPAGVFIIS